MNRFRKAARSTLELMILSFNRLRFRLFFKRAPGQGEYCNSRRIRSVRHAAGATGRRFLVVVRCGESFGLVRDCTTRNFDIALNPYQRPDTQVLADCEYVFSGGVNKYSAFRQFLTKSLLQRYDGFMLIDDDVQMSFSELGSFLEYCRQQSFDLAQPSLTQDSFYSHRELLFSPHQQWRKVKSVEVMCPYFSSKALARLAGSFNLSLSTWGLDVVWPRILECSPVVVDKYQAMHARALGASGFYRYMRSIGASPDGDLDRLSRMDHSRLVKMVSRNARDLLGS